MLITTRSKQLFSVTHSDRHMGIQKKKSIVEILKDQISILPLSFVVQMDKLISIILNKDPSKIASFKQNCKFFKNIFISSVNY